MASDQKTIYIKGDRNTEVQKRDVTLGDIIEIECSDKNIVNRIKAIKILKIQPGQRHRYVISVMKIIQTIHEQYPQIEVQNLGETDLIITYEEQTKTTKTMHYLKIAVVAAITFFGAAFAIMAFNNDASVTKVFSQVYKLFTGTKAKGITSIDIGYSLGIAIGIIFFFNHFGKKRFTVDPTPMEIQIRLYENDIQSTIVENASRKGKEISVDQTNNITTSGD